MPRFYYFLVTLILINAGWNNVGAEISAMEKSVLTGNWQTIYDIVNDTTANYDEINEFLKDITCLTLDLDCAPQFYDSFLPNEKSSESVEKWIKSLRRKQKDNAILSYLLGSLYSRAGNHKKALKELNNAVRQDNEIAAIYMARAIAKSLSGKLQSGFEDVNRAILLDPNHSMGYTHRGAYYDSQKEYQSALEDYAKAISLKPKRAANYYNRANTYRHMNRNVGAISDYTRAIDLDSTLVGAYFNRGNAYFDETEIELALNDYRNFVAVRSEEFPQQLSLAQEHIKLIEKIIKRANGDKASILVELGFVSFGRNDYESAVAHVNKALIIDSTNSDAYYWRASANMRLGNKQLAIDDFTRAINYHPEDTTAYFNRGVLFVELEKVREAITDFSSAIELNNKYTLALRNRARAYESISIIDSAIFDYKSILKTIPESKSKTRNDIENHIAFLNNPNIEYDKRDMKEIKNTVKNAYKLWEKKKWDKFYNTMHPYDLEILLNGLLSFYDYIFGKSDYVGIRGKFYRKSSFVNVPPEESFANFMSFITQNASMKSIVTIKFIEIIEILPRGPKNAVARIRIKGASEVPNNEMVIENGVEKLFSKWVINMPPPLARLVNVMNKGESLENEQIQYVIDPYYYSILQ